MPRKRKASKTTDEDALAPLEKLIAKSNRTLHVNQSGLDIDVFCSHANADVLLSCGTNDCGQLGYDREKCTKFRRVDIQFGSIDQVVAGGMHSVLLTTEGDVYTWGVSDDGALGRTLDDADESSAVPTLVEMPKEAAKVQLCSAGDCHTAFLTDDGAVWACGSFKDPNGNKFLTEGQCSSQLPIRIYKPKTANDRAVKVSSGFEHLVILRADGVALATGSGQNGQLGLQYVPRWERQRALSGNEQSVFHLPAPMRFRHKRGSPRTVMNVWAAGYATFLQFEDKTVLSCGLNNYHQLGIEDTEADSLNAISFPTVSMLSGRLYKDISGDHFIAALAKDGKVYNMGRSDDGRLGVDLQEEYRSKLEPAVLPEGAVATCMTASSATTLVTISNGSVFAWGFNSSYQLGLGPVEEEEDRVVTTPTQAHSQHLVDHVVVGVSSGGQHSLAIAKRLV